jgi:hemerythrin
MKHEHPSEPWTSDAMPREPRPSAKWRTDYTVGLDDIDAQHRYFFELMKAMDRTKRTHDDRCMRALLDELARYGRYHFGCEERLMECYAYPDASRHIGEHRKIEEKLAQFLATDPIDLAKLRMTLYQWFVGHTTLEDKQLAAHVQNVRTQAMRCVERR